MEKLDPRKSTPYAFIPKRLEIPDNPELSVFPFNIMFMSLANIDGNDTSGTALYLPDLESYTGSGKTESMRYFNQYQKADGGHFKTDARPASYDGQDYIDINYFKDSGKYEAEKYVSGQNTSTTVGGDWKMFFVHLTMVGLATNESCDFKPMK